MMRAPLRYANTPHQRMSWLRANISLIFHEANRRGCYVVSRTAMELLVERAECLQLRVLDPVWVKNALATCSNAEEMRSMERILRKYQEKHIADTEVSENLSSSLQGGNETQPLALLNNADYPSSTEYGISPFGGYSGVALNFLSMRRVNNVTAPNHSFCRYFIRQGLVADEAELMELFRSMIGRRPVAFRVHTSQMYGAAMAEVIRGRSGIESLRWLPEGCAAFVMDDSPSVPHSVLLANRQLLHTLAKEKLISFQSTSSMLPVLLLDPQPGERVLDLCASPGSKTSLMLDYISSRSPSSRTSPFRHGCVIANDASPSRSRQLAQRLRDSCPTVAVTQFTGQSVSLKPSFAGGNKYNKILVDAPCSGEGRMQRDAMSWRMWHPLRGIQFMQEQLQLLRRAVDLCSVGGYIVYSTCTLNPLENEAVVAAVLRDGAVELVKPSVQIREGSGWRFNRGLRRWAVPSRAGGFFNTAAELESKGESPPVQLADLFSYEGNESIQSALESCCLRVLPHRNGGAEGFFVALLRKLPFNLCSASTTTANEGSRTSRGIGGHTNSSWGSFPTNSITCESLLHTYGVVKLQVGNMLLQKLLGGFFNDDADQLESYLTQQNLCAGWREGQGLIISSQSTWSQLDATAPVSSTKPTLLELGITVIDGATGNLTAAGAYHLRPWAHSRILNLPLMEVQWLLFHHVLKVEEHQLDPTVLARCMVAGVSVSGGDVDSHQRRSATPWVKEILNAIGGREGSFIVCCSLSSIEEIYGPGSAQNSAAARGLRSISVPVVVRRTPSIELHVSLSHDARRLCTAVLGRILSHKRRSDAPSVEKNTMQLSSQYNVSATMSSTELEGRRLTPQRQRRRLHNENFLPPTVTEDDVVPQRIKKQQGTHNSGENFFFL